MYGIFNAGKAVNGCKTDLSGSGEECTVLKVKTLVYICVGFVVLRWFLLLIRLLMNTMNPFIMLPHFFFFFGFVFYLTDIFREL